MGTLYCCCNKADIMTCDRCTKNKKLNPERIINVPEWRKERFIPQEKEKKE